MCYTLRGGVVILYATVRAAVAARRLPFIRQKCDSVT